LELFADGQHDGHATRVVMAPEGLHYRASVSAARSASDYTPRLTVASTTFAGPLEAPWILWQK
jgi:phosphotransferase system HPr-like phosphotransfer protein